MESDILETTVILPRQKAAAQKEFADLNLEQGRGNQVQNWKTARLAFFAFAISMSMLIYGAFYALPQIYHAFKSVFFPCLDH